jgi:hypothetical protein
MLLSGDQAGIALIFFHLFAKKQSVQISFISENQRSIF